jgi:hypothetical protein
MKTQNRYYLAVVALLLSACVSLQPGADPVVVNAEKTAALAKDTFDTFLKLDRENEAVFRQIGAHALAETLRHRESPTQPPNGIRWIQTLRSVTKTYKQNRTAENRASVDTWLKTVSDALKQTTQYIAQSGLKGP